MAWPGIERRTLDLSPQSDSFDHLAMAIAFLSFCIKLKNYFIYINLTPSPEEIFSPCPLTPGSKNLQPINSKFAIAYCVYLGNVVVRDGA